MRKQIEESTAAESARRATRPAAERDRKGRFSTRRKRATVLREKAVGEHAEVQRRRGGVLDGGRPVLFDEGEHAEDAPDADGPTRRGRWPSPRRPRAGSPTPLSASTPDGPTSARWRAWTPGGGPPRLTTPRWPSTSASSSRRAARPPPPLWPSPPSGVGPSSPASRPPPGKRPPACWAATVARPPTGAGARPPRYARTGSPRFSPPPPGPARTAGASNPTPRRTAGADSTP